MAYLRIQNQTERERERRGGEKKKRYRDYNVKAAMISTSNRTRSKENLSKPSFKNVTEAIKQSHLQSTSVAMKNSYRECLVHCIAPRLKNTYHLEMIFLILLLHKVSS